MATLTNFHRFNNTGPVAIAMEANAIRRGVSAIFSNRGDRVARQTAFLRDVAREHPQLAELAVLWFRERSASYARMIDVPEGIIGMYARVMEEQLDAQKQSAHPVRKHEREDPMTDMHETHRLNVSIAHNVYDDGAVKTEIIYDGQTASAVVALAPPFISQNEEAFRLYREAFRIGFQKSLNDIGFGSSFIEERREDRHD